MTHAITEPGIYEMSAEAYHQDPCAEPSLSSSIIKLLIERSAMHAWDAHPRLNPAHEAENKTDFDIGSAAHKLLLGKGAAIVDLDFGDYKKAAAREARDAAYAEGKIPLLPHHREAVDRMVEAARMQIDALDMKRRPFTDGLPERVLIWKEGDVWCRAMLDWYSHDGAFIDDLKTTTNAEPNAFARRIGDLGYDIQAAWYRRGAERVSGRLPEFRFVTLEKERPHALSVPTLKESDLHAGNEKIDVAVDRWRWCLANDKWPGYPRQPVTVEMPVGARFRWEDMKASEELAHDATGKSLIELGIEYHRPLEMSR